MHASAWSMDHGDGWLAVSLSPPIQRPRRLHTRFAGQPCTFSGMRHGLSLASNHLPVCPTKYTRYLLFPHISDNVMGAEIRTSVFQNSDGTVCRGFVLLSQLERVHRKKQQLVLARNSWRHRRTQKLSQDPIPATTTAPTGETWSVRGNSPFGNINI
jgi:hypothetical protein